MLALQNLLNRMSKEERDAFEQKNAARQAARQNPLNWAIDLARERNGDFRPAVTTSSETATKNKVQAN